MSPRVVQLHPARPRHPRGEMDAIFVKRQFLPARRGHDDPRRADAYFAALPTADNDFVPLKPKDFPPKPEFSKKLELCVEGLVLGKGTVIVPWRPGKGAELALHGREDAIRALLSVAGLRLVPTDIMHGLSRVARALTRNDASFADIALTQSGLPILASEAAAEALALAAEALECGASPVYVLKWAGLMPSSDRFDKFRPDYLE